MEKPYIRTPIGTAASDDMWFRMPWWSSCYGENDTDAKSRREKRPRVAGHLKREPAGRVGGAWNGFPERKDVKRSEKSRMGVSEDPIRKTDFRRS